jgi:hypothetical protein
LASYARSVEIKRIRNRELQTLETLINEEDQLFKVPPWES